MTEQSNIHTSQKDRVSKASLQRRTLKALPGPGDGISSSSLPLPWVSVVVSMLAVTSPTQTAISQDKKARNELNLTGQSGSAMSPACSSLTPSFPSALFCVGLALHQETPGRLTQLQVQQKETPFRSAKWDSLKLTYLSILNCSQWNESFYWTVWAQRLLQSEEVGSARRECQKTVEGKIVPYTESIKGCSLGLRDWTWWGKWPKSISNENKESRRGRSLLGEMNWTLSLLFLRLW